RWMDFGFCLSAIGRRGRGRARTDMMCAVSTLRRLAIGAALPIFMACFPNIALGQPQSTPAIGKIEVAILNAIHEPEESSVSYVTLSVTVWGAGTSLVIPTCAEAGEKNIFCVASL